jgi:TRAP-type C4-dicarboxylate transport system permease small subunit
MFESQAPTAARSGWLRLGGVALNAFRAISTIVVFALMLHTLANVALRYVFNSPLGGTLEYVSYWYMPIVAFLGMILAKQARQIIEAPILFDRLSWVTGESS